jgi:hypothetical protein
MFGPSMNQLMRTYANHCQMKQIAESFVDRLESFLAGCGRPNWRIGSNYFVAQSLSAT